MQKIREELQEMEDEQMDGYQLKTNEEIIDIISEFGNGETEFHTLDIDRLVIENERVKELIKRLQPTIHNDDNEYVKGIESVVKELKKIL